MMACDKVFVSYIAVMVIGHHFVSADHGNNTLVAKQECVGKHCL